MAIVTPVIAGLALVSAEVWMSSMDKQRAENALHAAADYYMGGGGSDDEAAQVAMTAWSEAPSDATVGLAREGRCGTQAGDLARLCADGMAPAVYVTLAASGTSQGLFEAHAVRAERTIRVR